MNAIEAVRKKSPPGADPPAAPADVVEALAGPDELERAIREGLVYQVNGVVKVAETRFSVDTKRLGRS